MTEFFSLTSESADTRSPKRKPYIAGESVPRILNLGAGVQSTAVYLLAMDGELLPIDVAIFADTGDEPADVYKHLEWLRSLGGPEIMVRDPGYSLSDALIHGVGESGRFPAIPTFSDSGIGKRQCTREMKVDVVERAIRREVLGLAPGEAYRGDRVTQVFGLSFEEGRRIVKVKDRLAHGALSVGEFPLWEMEWKRADCLHYLKDRVPHPVPRSACVYCPYRSDAEWIRLRDTDPGGWSKAIEVDRAIRESAASYGRLEPGYVHDSLKPLELVQLDPGHRPLLDASCDEGVCFT